MKLQRIFLTEPNPENKFSTYDNQLEPQYLFDVPEFEEIFRRHEDELMNRVGEELENYINDDDLCNDDEGMFPKPSMLTGEWYLREVSSEDDILFILTALLGIDTGKKDDYLGLEVTFTYDSDEDAFDFDGINSEAL
ncbi:MAG: hypothetical protein IJ779_05800 [Ruminococcus sp.]|nr:hypothetical protein [Ruminococcus sp.]